MKKLRRLLFRLLLFVLLIIIGVVCFKTLTYTPKQFVYAPVEKVVVSDAVVKRLAEAVRFPTVSYEDRVDTLAFDNLHAYMEKEFVLVDSFLEKEMVNEFSVVYHWPGKNQNLKPILLLAHLDVVPVEKESQSLWTQLPYSGKIEKGIIWGRGTLDDKVSAFGILEAIELLLQKNYQPERSIYLAFGHDEEVGGENGAIAIARRFKQEGLDFEFILDEGSVLLENALPGLSKPVAMIGNSEKGYTTLSLTAQLPQGGHSSMPPKETAIGILSKALVTLEEHPFPGKIEGPVKDLFDHVGPEMEWPHKLVFANLWLFEGILVNQLSAAPTSNAVLRTTTALTMLDAGVKDNVLPSQANAKINFRILPGETSETVASYVRQTIGDDRIKVKEDNPEFSSAPSKISSTTSFGYNVLQRTTREIYEEVVVAPMVVIAATDSRHYSELSENIFRFLPVQLTNADLKCIHGIDEKISIDTYKKAIQFYYQMILNGSK